MRPIRIAMTKGRLETKSVELFERAGIDCSEIHNKGRRLILPLGNGMEAVLAKAADVITYVENGVCDIGITGKDTIMEFGTSIFEILDLGFGRCKFAVAAPRGSDVFGALGTRTIATKYPNVTRHFFEELGMDVNVIKIEGSVELAPLLSLADAIVDIVETGTTLKENGLEVVRDVCPISARIICNIASLKLRQREIEDFTRALENALVKGE